MTTGHLRFVDIAQIDQDRRRMMARIQTTAHLIEIARTVAPGAHAVLLMDGAGWHKSEALVVPDAITLLILPPYAPELNPVEDIWQYLRRNTLAHRLYESYEAIVEACCEAWNGLIAAPGTITSIAVRDWANVSA